MLAQINIGKRVLTVENESLKPENSQKDSLFHVERCLDNWSRWMRGTEAPDGLPQEACVGENYTTYDAHSEQAYDKLDIWPSSRKWYDRRTKGRGQYKDLLMFVRSAIKQND